MAKKLIVNCATCDARKVNAETLEAYESMEINCASLLVSSASKALLARYPVQMNCAHVLEIPEDVHISFINGKAAIKDTDRISGKQYLIVNGALEIGAGTGKVLEQYVGIVVNGKALYPESVQNALPHMKVNGKTVCYPDGAVILKNNTAIDRLFALRAKNACYWTDGRLLMVDLQMDPAILASKGARFCARKALIAESLVEGVIGLIDEKTEIAVVPDGVRVVADDVKLDAAVVRKYGGRLYILGDVKIEKADGQALSDISYLYIQGDAMVAAEWKDALLAKAEIRGDVRVLKGRYITDRATPVKVTKWLLEREQEGVHVADCLRVEIAEDVDKDMILDRLTITDCVKVHCSPEQRDAVEAVCEDVADISTSDQESDKDGILRKALGAGADLLQTKVVNAAEYVL